MIALDMLSIAPLSNSAQRNWPTFGYIYSKSRNRLRNSMVEKLVFTYTNANLLAITEHEGFRFDEQEVLDVDEIVDADGSVLDSFEGEENEVDEKLIHNY